MPQQFTLEEIQKLQSLGIDVKESRPVKGDVDLSTEGSPEKINFSPSSRGDAAKPRGVSPAFPLLSISGLTLLSFGGLVLLKGNSNNNQNKMYGQTDVSAQNQTSTEITPTQVPKSIQHYLLTSQQYFSQAVSQQSTTTNSSSTVDLLNNSILAATEAIKEFPDDYRGYQQRGIIYQALIDSKPDLIDQSISDFATAFKLNSSSAEVTRSLATLYAKKGDANKTILYLTQTVSLEPTKAQNFYDLATIQQQAGYLGDALDTYTKLIPLITDDTQKAAVESQKTTIESIIAKNPDVGTRHASSSLQEDTDSPQVQTDSPTIQAMADGGLIIADSQEDSSIAVSSQTDSNSLSGNTTLPSGQKEITIANDNISSTSQVYVTITKGGKNQNLQVLSKSDKSFTVGLDSSISEDVEFKWWIIN